MMELCWYWRLEIEDGKEKDLERCLLAKAELPNLELLEQKLAKKENLPDEEMPPIEMALSGLNLVETVLHLSPNFL